MTSKINRIIKRVPVALAVTALLLSAHITLRATEWRPASGVLSTRWAQEVTPETAHREYPRMQMRRDAWLNLNGLWDYAITPQVGAQPDTWQGKILVPFPVESALSGVMRRVSEVDRLWYRRVFETPDAWHGKQVLLHFGAVDWETTVWVNGAKAGAHRGGYDRFTFDVTDLLKPTGAQEIVVAVHDPSDAGTQPIGKQVREPKGIRYTPSSGIWQTVWLEPVTPTYMEAIKIVPDVDQGTVSVKIHIQSPGQTVIANVEVRDGKQSIADATAQSANPPAGAPLVMEVTLPIKNARLWTPDSPHLYDLELSLSVGGQRVDRIESYFAMRKISMGPDADGIQRLLLNNQPLFQYGLLDQGFWPDGLHTAPTDEALRYDIELTKDLGFNLARKHVKVEPDRWYYWCDKLGLLVWQDMPSGDASVRRGEPDLRRTPESAHQFEVELKAMISSLENHPCIVMWVPFNEGWGQYDTARIVDLVKTLDPTRLVIGASGWVDRGVGDVNDIHQYPGPGVPPPEANRVAVLGEFGGLGLPVRGHSWQDEKNWGYRSFNDAAALTKAYLRMVDRLHPLIGAPGLAAAVYTQTTDVEIEVNGLITYDRAVLKVDKAQTRAANLKLHSPPPPLLAKAIIPTAEEDRIRWHYATETPAANWAQPEFDPKGWKSGRAGFGGRELSGAPVLTVWDGKKLWLRRTFQMPADTTGQEIALRIFHTGTTEVYLNGKLAAKLTGNNGDYVSHPLSPEARGLLRRGENTIAVHCAEAGSQPFIDLGLTTGPIRLGK